MASVHSALKLEAISSVCCEWLSFMGNCNDINVLTSITIQQNENIKIILSDIF